MWNSSEEKVNPQDKLPKKMLKSKEPVLRYFFLLIIKLTLSAAGKLLI